jgi:hypothetical protein
MNTRAVFRSALLLGVLALFIGLGALLLPGRSRANRAEAYSPSTVTTVNLFLPFLAKSLPGIAGNVTLNGVAAPGIGVSLQFYNGVSTTPLLATNTASDGSYQFLGAPSLAKGQHYDVEYVRPTGVTDTLRNWTTNSITDYVSGGAVAMAPFDIADVPLVQPTANATATLPVTFQWTVRPSSPLDSYALEIRNSAISTTWSSGFLGYTGTYPLPALPSGFSLGVKYPWYIKVQSPAGTGSTSSQDVIFQ